LPEFRRVEMGSEKVETARSPQTPTSVDLHIDPKAMKYTQKGPWYNARLHTFDGKVLVCSTEPLFAACRELVKRGITGHIRKYRNGVLSAHGDIEELAGLTVCESDSRGPVIRKHRPMPPRRVTALAPEAVRALEAQKQPAKLSPEIELPRNTP
jgi:hypothetical protein